MMQTIQLLTLMEKMKGYKWIRTDDGSYEVEVGDSKEEEDSKEETSDDINVEH